MDGRGGCRPRRKQVELTDRHLENLRALKESPTGLIRSNLPQPRLVKALEKEDLIEVCGGDWIATITITDKGLRVLEDHDAEL